MLKYIIFSELEGTEHAQFCLCPMTHRELALSAQQYRHGRTIKSAGFVEWVGGEARTCGFSDSLEMGPRPKDAAYLTAFARGTAMAAGATMDRTPAPTLSHEYHHR